MYRLSFHDGEGNVVSTRDGLFATEGDAVITGVTEVKAGCPHNLYIEEDESRRPRYAHFIPNVKVKRFLDDACGDVLNAANALNNGGSQA